MKQLLRSIPLFLLLFGFAASVATAQLFVNATTGNDATFDGTSPTAGVPGPTNGPKQTINGAIAVAAPGDIINVARGQYNAFTVPNTLPNISIRGVGFGINPNQADITLLNQPPWPSIANSARCTSVCTINATGVTIDGWDPLESTCRHASLSIL